jgi:putative FmdB family regulatory protein
MPVFDFKCEKCDERIEVSMPWSRTMAEGLDACKCGEKKWQQYITVSRSKFAEPDKDPAVNQANEMMSGKGWT